MKKLIYLILSAPIIFSSCNQAPAGPSAEDQAVFEKNIATFQSFAQNFNEENLDGLMSFVADSVKWSPPYYNENKLLGYDDFSAAVTGYFDNFEDITFVEGKGLIGSDKGFWGGSTFSSGSADPNPNILRVYGTWMTTHTATGAPANNKWYAVISFDEDGKIATFSDWMDVNGMNVQIEQYVASQEAG